MFWSSKRLLGLKVAAADGPIGSIYDIYFEDDDWRVRYFVVDTGGWLGGSRVLLSPRVVGRPDVDESRIPVSLTQEQIRRSPPYDSEKPISLQYELELTAHYTWPDPTTYSEDLGMSLPPVPPPPAPRLVPRAVDASAVEHMPGPHLRSIRDLFGYSIHVRGGEIGTAEDFVVEDPAWRIDRIVVGTGSWFSGRKVAVTSAHSRKIRWSEQAIFLDVTRDDIEHAPEFDPESQIEPVTQA